MQYQKEDLFSEKKPNRKKIIIIILILLAIIIILIFLLYRYFNPKYQLNLGAEIKNVLISEDGKTAYLKVEGGSIDKNITKIKFIFYDQSEKEYYYETIEGAEEFSLYFKKSWFIFAKPSYEGRYDYEINADEIGLDNFKNIKRIEVFFEYETDSGDMTVTLPLDSEEQIYDEELIDEYNEEFNREETNRKSDADNHSSDTENISSDLKCMQCNASAFDEWRVLPIRSEEEYSRGMTGGEAEQHLHGIARSISNPDIIYWSQDVGQVWKSEDAGETWKRTIGKGLYLRYSQSIEVDPVNPDKLFVIVDNVWWDDLNRDFEGIYMSTNEGDDWKLVLPTPVNFNQDKHRMYTHNIAYDFSSKDNSGAKVWYAAFVENGLYKSDDYGSSWNKVADIKGHEKLYGVYTHPNDGQTIYLASSKGLFISKTKGTNLQETGNLPDGSVTSVAINPQNPNIIYATLMYSKWSKWINYSAGDSVYYGDIYSNVTYYKSLGGNNLDSNPAQNPDKWEKFSTTPGLYKSTNGGNTFNLLKKFDVWAVFMNQGYPETLYLAGFTPDYWKNSPTIVTHDGGASWITEITVTPFPGLGRDTYIKRITGSNTGIVPNSKNKEEAVVFSESHIYKTKNGGKNFTEVSTLFTGFAAWLNSGFAFDKFNPKKFALFLSDVSMALTENGGNWFKKIGNTADSKTIWDWYSTDNKIPWIGSYAGDIQPIENSQVMVASIGNNFRTKIMRLENEEKGWEIVDNDLKDNFVIKFNSNNPNIVYAGEKISYDAGKTFNYINFKTEDGKNLSYLHPLEIHGVCFSNPDVVYAMAQYYTAILRSDNSGKTWRVYQEPRVDWKFIKKDRIAAFAVDPIDCNKIYAMDKYGDITSYDGKEWKSLGLLKLITAPQELSVFIRTIAIDYNNNSIIYAGIGAAGVSNVWRSINSGETWEDISYNLPRIDLQAMAVNPHTGELFVGGAVGTWIFPPPYKSESMIYYNNAYSVPSYYDKADNAECCDETELPTYSLWGRIIEFSKAIFG